MNRRSRAPSVRNCAIIIPRVKLSRDRSGQVSGDAPSLPRVRTTSANANAVLAGKALNRPKIRTRAEQMGYKVLASDTAQLSKRIAREVSANKKLIDTARIPRRYH